MAQFYQNNLEILIGMQVDIQYVATSIPLQLSWGGAKVCTIQLLTHSSLYQKYLYVKYLKFSGFIDLQHWFFWGGSLMLLFWTQINRKSENRSLQSELHYKCTFGSNISIVLRGLCQLCTCGHCDLSQFSFQKDHIVYSCIVSLQRVNIYFWYGGVLSVTAKLWSSWKI